MFRIRVLFLNTHLIVYSRILHISVYVVHTLHFVLELDVAVSSHAVIMD